MVFILTFFLSFNLFSKEIPSPVLDPHNYFVSNCEIFNIKGELVRRYAGTLCSYIDNGSLVVGDGINLTFYDSQMKTINSIQKIYPHHQLNRSDNNEILTMGAEFGMLKNKKVRFDKLFVLSTAGKILKSYSFKDHYLEMIENKTFRENLVPFSWDLNTRSFAEFEVTHMNSFYRIPKQLHHLENSFFKEGNYVAHSGSCPFILIFDSTLTKVIHRLSKKFPPQKPFMLHDVQPTPSGEIIVYQNYIWADPEAEKLSKVEIYDAS